MPQQFCAQTVPMAEALALVNTGDGTKTVTIIRDIPLPWQTAPLETVLASGQNQCVVLPGNSHTIDAYHHTWLIVVYVGCAGQPTQVALVDQKDQGNIDSLLTGAAITTSGWAILGKIVADEILDWHQQGGTLPAGVAGDILYHDGTSWVRRAIGNVNDVLIVSSGLLPVWSPGVVSGPLLIVSDTTSLGLNLWNGSSNDAAPTNWYGRTFDDSAWAACVSNEPSGPTPSPTHGIWADPANVTDHGIALIRKHFTPGIGAITSARIPAVGGDCLYIYLNGTNIFTSSDLTNGSNPPSPLTIDPTLFLPGEDNVLALSFTNTTISSPYVYFSLATNTA